jgi:hypothetical protein
MVSSDTFQAADDAPLVLYQKLDVLGHKGIRSCTCASVRHLKVHIFKRRSKTVYPLGERVKTFSEMDNLS